MSPSRGGEIFRGEVNTGKAKLSAEVLLHAGAVPHESRWSTFGITDASIDADPNVIHRSMASWTFKTRPKAFKRALSARNSRAAKRDAWESLSNEQRELLLGRPEPNRRPAISYVLRLCLLL